MARIQVQQLDEIPPHGRMAFGYASDVQVVFLSSSGHATILRGREDLEWECGGWLNIHQGKVSQKSGSLGKIPKHLEDLVIGSIEYHFSQPLRLVR